MSQKTVPWDWIVKLVTLPLYWHAPSCLFPSIEFTAESDVVLSDQEKWNFLLVLLSWVIVETTLIRKKIYESVYKCLQGHAMTSKCILLRFNYLSWSNPPCHCSDLPHLLHPPHYSNLLRLLLVLCILNLYKSYWKYYLKKQCFYYYSPALFGWLTWMQEQKKSCKASLRSREGKWTL